MKTQIKTISELFEGAKCVACQKPLTINVDSTTGYFKKEGQNLLAIDEVDGELLFAADINTNQTNFSNTEVKNRLEVFVLELECTKHKYRQIYSLYLDKVKYDIYVSKILLDEENILLVNKDHAYWVRNVFCDNGESWTEITSWNAEDGPPPKSQFDLDMLDDLFATFKLETECIKIETNIKKFQEKIERLITFR